MKTMRTMSVLNYNINIIISISIIVISNSVGAVLHCAG